MGHLVMIDNTEPELPSTTSYIGDGVYAQFDGYNIILYTLEGMKIYMDPIVAVAMREYIKKVYSIQD